MTIKVINLKMIEGDRYRAILFPNAIELLDKDTNISYWFSRRNIHELIEIFKEIEKSL